MTTETITWTCASTRPDADQTVLIHMPTADEPVSLGYWTGMQWMTVESYPLDAGDVTHWAAMPGGPAC
jgi:hypothetical protein